MKCFFIFQFQFLFGTVLTLCVLPLCILKFLHKLVKGAYLSCHISERRGDELYVVVVVVVVVTVRYLNTISVHRQNYMQLCLIYALCPHMYEVTLFEKPQKKKQATELQAQITRDFEHLIAVNIKIIPCGL